MPSQIVLPSHVSTTGILSTCVAAAPNCLELFGILMGIFPIWMLENFLQTPIYRRCGKWNSFCSLRGFNNHLIILAGEYSIYPNLMIAFKNKLKHYVLILVNHLNRFVAQVYIPIGKRLYLITPHVDKW